MFPNAPEPWIDLSTGVNPYSYPDCALSGKALSRLPDPAELALLKRAAALAYDSETPDSVVPAPGTQPLLPLIMRAVDPGRASILGPTYSEYARCAALTGHRVIEVDDIDDLARADLAIVVNPNNPDGRLHAREDLLDLAGLLKERGGILLVDEAFMDVPPRGPSLVRNVPDSNIVVLRSFGKFFGLPGLRLSFAIAPDRMAKYLSACLGPWPVSGPAIEIGARALNDLRWQETMRGKLATASGKLDAMLTDAKLRIEGGTHLFRLAKCGNAQELHDHLGRSGLLARRFAERPNMLRFGLPPDNDGRARLERSLRLWQRRNQA